MCVREDREDQCRTQLLKLHRLSMRFISGFVLEVLAVAMSTA